MYQYQFNSMSTMVKISINQEMFANDLMPIYKLFELIESTCSRFKVDSELSQLNKQIGKQVTVSSEMFSILTDAEHYFLETCGVFNPGVLTSLESSGYVKSIEYIKGQSFKLPGFSPNAIHNNKPFVLDKEQQSVILFSKIDLGGIAKGWVIDRAAELLEEIGFGFINVGGDIRIFGALPRSLNIGIESPFDFSNLLSSIQIESGAVATSTTMKRRWKLNEEWQHHLIDPRTGQPSESKIVSATVTAPTAVEADVWAKTVLLLGDKDGKSFIREKRTQAVLIDQEGKIWRGGIFDGNVK
ncbi:FAD:protein FMN transferase [Neobacillus sp. M.A.Huq-85]|nr:FAD:protein FMN transferase [Neobacillus cucumis]